MSFNPLDIVTTVLGLAYILLEYRASVWMWVVGFIMQALGIVLYYDKGLYADCAMEFYYLAMTVYGFWRWSKRGERREERGERREERGLLTSTLQPQPFPPPSHSSLAHRDCCLVDAHLLAAYDIHRFYRSVGRQFYHCPQPTWYLGARPQVSGAVVYLDCRRCGDLCALCL